MSDFLDVLDAAMRTGQPVNISTYDHHMYAGTVINITNRNVWVVVGDIDKFIPLHRIKDVR